LKDIGLRAASFYEKGRVFFISGSNDSAVFYLNKVFDLNCRFCADSTIGEAYYLLGKIQRYTGQADSAIISFHKHLAINKKNADTFNQIAAYNQLGIAFKDLAQYDSSVYYYIKGSKLCNYPGFERYNGSLLINIGKILKLRGEYRRAKQNLLKSIPINEKFGNNRNIALAYTILGNIYNDTGNADSAVRYYREAENIYSALKYEKGLNDIYINLGEIYQKQGNYQQAIGMYDKALVYYRKANDYDGIITARTNKAAMLVFLKRYRDAENIYDSCLKIAARSNDIYNQKKIYVNLAELMSKTGKYRKAFEYEQKYITFHDSIFNLEKEKLINELQIKYERQKDKAQILAQQLDLKKRTIQKNILLFTGSGFVIILLLLIFYQRSVNRKNKIIAEQRIKQLEEEKKLLAARFLVEGEEKERKRIAKELHDGLGVLLSTAKMQFTAIKDKNPENEPLIRRALKLLEQATGDVRKISHNMMPGLLTKFGFYEAVEDLFEQLADTKKLSVEVEIHGDKKRLPENTEIMLYRITQEMVNNTLKHAGATHVSIQIIILEQQLSIDYSDNGIGFDIEKTLARKSIGMTSIISRVKFLNGNIDIQSKPGKGVNLHIVIPLKN
jgi:signal transduction histidine kinase